ncbi:MAG: DUF2238 domain-containing protein [Thermoanaerobaculia bacterium]
MRELNSSRYHAALLVAGLAVLVWSYIGAYDRMTWWLESIPAIVAAAMLIATYRRFRLTDLAYVLITIHAIILMVGGHYTYARVPPGDWVRDAFDLARNHYDRLGHFAQGFVPAIIGREILLRTSPLRRGKWLFFLVVCVCLAISAAYELIEWTTAIAAGDESTDFLGTQGDVWDAQKDMTLALIGAILAQLLLGWLHDRQLEKVTRGE